MVVQATNHYVRVLDPTIRRYAAEKSFKDYLIFKTKQLLDTNVGRDGNGTGIQRNHQMG